MPKENRNPKSERSGVVEPTRGEESAFWTSRNGGAGQAMVLHDGEVTPEPGPTDLIDRTAQFGEHIIRFAKKIPHIPENTRLTSQLVGAGTSIGANYCEADDSVSGKDFKKCIGVCRKEPKETMFFLRMIAASEESLKDEARKLR